MRSCLLLREVDRRSGLLDAMNEAAAGQKQRLFGAPGRLVDRPPVGLSVIISPSADEFSGLVRALSRNRQNSRHHGLNGACLTL